MIFKHILLVVNPAVNGETALERATVLTKKYGARLTIFSITKSHPKQHCNWKLFSGDSRIQNSADRCKWLQDCIKSMQRNGIEANSVSLTGILLPEIIRQVKNGRHDLVIIAADEKWMGREHLFGSISARLIRECPCPVWVMKQEQKKSEFHILAAVDPVPTNLERDSLNVPILILAASLARVLEAQLHVVHVWNPFPENYTKKTCKCIYKKFLENEELEKQVHKEKLLTLLSSINLADMNPQIHFFEGSPEECISDTTVKKSIDLLIMGTVGRAGLMRYVVGNTAEDIFNTVNCSMLVIKPKGFVSSGVLATDLSREVFSQPDFFTQTL